MFFSLSCSISNSKDISSGNTYSLLKEIIVCRTSIETTPSAVHEAGILETQGEFPPLLKH